MGRASGLDSSLRLTDGAVVAPSWSRRTSTQDNKIMPLQKMEPHAAKIVALAPDLSGCAGLQTTREHYWFWAASAVTPFL